MYFDVLVKIPENTGKISFNRRNGTTYVEYTYGRKYIPEKQYNVPQRTTIGKTDPSDETMMFPNPNFVKYFPEMGIQLKQLRKTEQKNSKADKEKAGNKADEESRSSVESNDNAENMEKQAALLDAIAKSKWSYEQIMDFLQSEPKEQKDGKTDIV